MRWLLKEWSGFDKDNWVRVSSAQFTVISSEFTDCSDTVSDGDVRVLECLVVIIKCSAGKSGNKKTGIGQSMWRRSSKLYFCLNMLLMGVYYVILLELTSSCSHICASLGLTLEQMLNVSVTV